MLITTTHINLDDQALDVGTEILGTTTKLETALRAVVIGQKRLGLIARSHRDGTHDGAPVGYGAWP